MRRKFIYLFFLLAFLNKQSGYFAQQNKIDSLLALLKNAKSDTNEVNILYQLSEESMDDKDVLRYAQQSLEIAQRINYDKGIANASNNIGYIYMNKSDFSEAIKLFRRSLKIEEEILKKSAPGSDLWNWAKQAISTSLNNFGFIYDKQGNFPQALQWYYKSLKIQEEIGDKQGIARSLNNIGAVYMRQGNIPIALEWYFKGLKIRREVGDKLGIGASLNNIGVIYLNQGDIPGALEWYHKSLKIREEIGDKHGISKSLNNIAYIYDSQGDIPKALEWYYKSLKISQEIEDKEGFALTLNNIGSIYMNQGVISKQQETKEKYFVKALECYNKSLKIKEEVGDKLGIANTISNIGSIYQKRGDNRNALEWFQKSLRLEEELGNKQGISSLLSKIGSVYLKEAAGLKSLSGMQSYKQAEEYCSQSLLIAKQLGFPENISAASEQLSKIYKGMAVNFFNKANFTKASESYKYALEMHELFKLMADSINNVKTRKSGLKKQMLYDFEKKENATKAIQEQKDLIALEELQRQRIVRNSFIGGFLLALFLAIVILRSYRQKRKANIEISAQKHIIEEKQKEILDSIRYAKRIQTALITNEKYIDKNLNRLKKD